MISESDVPASSKPDNVQKPSLKGLVTERRVNVTSMNDLIHTIDKIWLSAHPRKTASEGAAKLSPKGIQELFALLANAYWPNKIWARPIPENAFHLAVSFGDVATEAIIINGVVDNALIVLPDLRKSLVLTQIREGGTKELLSINAETALIALQVARDNSDSIVLTPPTLREMRLKEVAAELAITPQLFTELCVIAPSSLRHHS